MKKLPWVFFLVLFLFSSHFAFANEDNPSEESELADPAVNAPLDGGLVLLLAAGVAIGIKGAKNKTRSRKEVG